MDFDLSSIVPLLLDWYDKYARVLPWRSEPTPYRVWVSEIMLQQTRVEAVIPYFERFIDTLPDVRSLADASEDVLLKLWEGLGYYSRVRNLQKAARIIVNEHGGVIPSDFQTLCSLPGLGPYSAGAVASIAFGVRVPAVDGNVLRVISRVTANRDDIANAGVKRRITQQVTDILPSSRVGDFNQSLMELGATVCLPNGAPRCDVCPLSSVCRAGIEGLTDTIPAKSPKKPRTIENRTVFVIVCGDRLAVRRRTKNGLLAGLWELPNAEGTLSEAECIQAVTEMGFNPTHILPLPRAKHIFTHIEWHMTGYLVLVSDCIQASPLVFVSKDQIENEYTLPTAFAAYLGHYMDEFNTSK